MEPRATDARRSLIFHRAVAARRGFKSSEEDIVQTRRKISIALASCLGLALAASPLLAADTPAEPAKDKPSLSDSPYKNGPPPITGGYTDTSQGGTKGSGDMQALPPGVKPPSQGQPQPEKTPGSR